MHLAIGRPFRQLPHLTSLQTNTPVGVDVGDRVDGEADGATVNFIVGDSVVVVVSVVNSVVSTTGVVESEGFRGGVACSLPGQRWHESWQCSFM